jgi:hypothetical protein
MLGTVAAGTLSAATGAALASLLGGDAVTSGKNTILTENQLRGTREWRRDVKGMLVADDIRMQIKGYTSATSVHLGESIDFHVTTNAQADYTIGIYRLGYYGGDGARHMKTSPTLRGWSQPLPQLEPGTGMISCDWTPGWTLHVPKSWTSGLYLAVFTGEFPHGERRRSFIPFVVRDDSRQADLCVVLPFSTYQAYNQWPRDGKYGKSLYHGYVPNDDVGDAVRQDAPVSYDLRSRKVSFDRPYANDGLPYRFDYDYDFVQWVERVGFNVTYASNVDLHAGLIDVDRYAGLIFSGHDEYWSSAMRDVAHHAVAQGTSLAFMMANNVYWHIRFEPANGRENRVVVCYRDTDPAPDTSGPTIRWRTMDRGAVAEQGLLGVQYNGIVASPAPLVVRDADHWFWDGCRLKDGDLIPNIVDGEADGIDHGMPVPTGVRHSLLSASPYKVAGSNVVVGETHAAEATQNTSVYETDAGGLVFVAATFNWPLGLNRTGFQDARIERATTNLFKRMMGRHA